MPDLNVVFVKSHEVFAQRNKPHPEGFPEDRFPCYIFLPNKTLFYMKNKVEPILAIPIDPKKYDKIIKELNLAKLKVDADKSESGRKGRPLDAKSQVILNAIITGHEYTHQSKVIPALNKYLKSIDVPLTGNPRGICNGLAAVYCKYVLENREEEYFSMLRKIVEQSDSGNIKPDPKLNEFLRDVLYAASPDQFTVGMSQTHAAEQLKVTNPKNPSEHNNIKKIFQFSASATQDQWETIFHNLKIDGAVYTIGSKDHAISVKVFKDEIGTLKFRVCDPNYLDGVIDFPDAESLTAELVQQFQIKAEVGDSFPLSIDALENPYKPMANNTNNRLFPNKEALITSILDKPGNSSIIKETLAQETLAFAARENDYEIIDIILNKGYVPGPSALVTAIKCNSMESLANILQKYKFSVEPGGLMDDYYACAQAALKQGTRETVQFLSKTLPGFKEKLQKLPLEDKISLLELAAESRNPSSVQLALDLVGKKNIVEGVDIRERIMSSMVIDNAIASGNIQVLKLILERSPLTNMSQVEGFLEVAVKANNLNMVKYFLNLENHPTVAAGFEIKPEIIAAKFEITPELIKETDPRIIDRLIESGAKVPDASKEILLKQQSPGEEAHRAKIASAVNLIAHNYSQQVDGRLLKADPAKKDLINRKLIQVIHPLIVVGNFIEAQAEVMALKQALEVNYKPPLMGKSGAITAVDEMLEILEKAEKESPSFKQRFQALKQQGNPEVKSQPKAEPTAPAVTIHF